MPELPEVETVRQGLNQLTLHQRIEGGEVLHQPTLAYPFSVAVFLEGVEGCAIASWERRGKYLLAQLTTPQGKAGGWLGVHLRMTGQLFWLKQDEPLAKHTRLRLFFAGGQELRFIDIRTFGRIWWVPPLQEPSEVMTGLTRLGVEPLSEQFTVEGLGETLRKRRGPIKGVLLDQKVVAGLGNIYADEVLFQSRIRPDAIASTLTPQQVKVLHQAIVAVLNKAIERGGTTFSDFLNLLGVRGNYGDSAWVYGRTNQPCLVCQTPIQRMKISGRSSHFCPTCQVWG
ncbi:DNA-formamidopyrimidine glycosylase [Spirulina subsalsa FACHB-351]|uniref:Formamidopyrimidine-DNA glycosylase n=1 Tax=Spirulina subsalsa FACHB-351 TaxID=234711 RepID=A0ABT3L9F4_9CYAN|nr:DNA-formamidopyrimidine glycosylase [Spirulina subsalsa]MCW6038143.1 DNA-formamidopyrimidine glycosylase [Spirulina subsalsa FACHB-351]